MKLQGGFPKTIVLTEEIFCNSQDEEEQRPADESECKSSRERTEYHWRDGAYLKQ